MKNLEMKVRYLSWSEYESDLQFSDEIELGKIPFELGLSDTAFSVISNNNKYFKVSVDEFENIESVERVDRDTAERWAFA